MRMSHNGLFIHLIIDRPFKAAVVYIPQLEVLLTYETVHVDVYFLEINGKT